MDGLRSAAGDIFQSLARTQHSWVQLQPGRRFIADGLEPEDAIVEIPILVPALTARKLRQVRFGRFHAAANRADDVPAASLDHSFGHALDRAQLRNAAR